MVIGAPITSSVTMSLSTLRVDWTSLSHPAAGSAGYVELDFKCPVMMHDMGVTENYAILPEVIMDGFTKKRVALE